MGAKTSQSLVVKFKMMYQMNGVVQKGTYQVKLKKYLQDLKEVLTADVTDGKVTIRDLDLEMRNFYKDEVNSQTLVFAAANVTLDGQFKQIEEENPEYTQNLLNFMQQYMDSFDPQSKAKQKKPKPSPDKKKKKK